MRVVISLKHFLPAALVAAVGFAATFAQECNTSGCLDGSFHGDGILQASLPNSLRAGVQKIAPHTDGSVVALFENVEQGNVYRPVMARYFADGSIDAGFGGGLVYLDWPKVGSGGPKNLAVQSDGKVVVVGYSPLGRNSIALRMHRYNYDGTPDAGFGSGGVVTVNVMGSITLALLPFGKILTMNGDGKLIQFKPDGSLDTDFGSGGIASPKLALSPWYNGLAVLPSGKIIATGHTVVSGLYRFTVGGYNTNGSLDDGSRTDSTPEDQFGSKGSVIISFPGYSGGRGYTARIDAAGRIVLMGAAGTQNTTTALARLTAGGQFDTGFAGTGKRVFTQTSGYAQGGAMALQSDGRIVVIGGLFYPDRQTRDAMVARFTTDGALDAFGTNPLVVYDASAFDEACYDGAVVSGDRILWAGMIAADQGAIRIPLMMRFLP